MKRYLVLCGAIFVLAFLAGYLTHMPGDNASRAPYCPAGDSCTPSYSHGHWAIRPVHFEPTRPCTSPSGAVGQFITVRQNGTFSYGTTGWPSQSRVCTTEGWKHA
jgi:hypothetical protein